MFASVKARVSRNPRTLWLRAAIMHTRHVMSDTSPGMPAVRFIRAVSWHPRSQFRHLSASAPSYVGQRLPISCSRHTRSGCPLRQLLHGLHWQVVRPHAVFGMLSPFCGRRVRKRGLPSCAEEYAFGVSEAFNACQQRRHHASNWHTTPSVLATVCQVWCTPIVGPLCLLRDAGL